MAEGAYLRPPWFARVVGNRMAALLNPSVRVLSVRGRISGQWRAVAVVVLEHQGAAVSARCLGPHPRVTQPAGSGRGTPAAPWSDGGVHRRGDPGGPAPTADPGVPAPLPEAAKARRDLPEAARPCRPPSVSDRQVPASGQTQPTPRLTNADLARSSKCPARASRGGICRFTLPVDWTSSPGIGQQSLDLHALPSDSRSRQALAKPKPQTAKHEPCHKASVVKRLCSP